MGDIDGDLGEGARLDQYLVALQDLRARLETRWRLTDIPLPHRRAGALRPLRGDRRQDRLHHAADP